MRIGVLTTSFPRFEDDVAGSFVLGSCRALSRRGHRVDVLAPEPRERLPVPTWPGVAVHWVPYARPRTWESTFYGAGFYDNIAGNRLRALGALSFPLALYLRTIARSSSWDAIITHWGLPSALVGSVACAQKRHVSIWHSADLHLLRSLKRPRPIARLVARRSSSLMFVSETARDEFISWLPAAERPSVRARTLVSPIGFSESPPPSADRNALRKAFGFGDFTVLSIGRLIPLKGLDIAIDAVASMSKIELVVAGDGPERTRLERRAKRLGARVRFLGTITGQRKADVLHASDAFVLPSRITHSGRTEGVPVALLEAMHTGLAAVASNVGGISELPGGEHALLSFTPDSPRELSAAFARLRDDPELVRVLGARARDEVSRFTFDALAPKFETLLRST